jgi:hypothetical protein
MSSVITIFTWRANWFVNALRPRSRAGRDVSGIDDNGLIHDLDPESIHASG